MPSPVVYAPVWPVPVAFAWGVITAVAPPSFIEHVVLATAPWVIDLPIALLCVVEGVLVRLRASSRPSHGAFGGSLVASAYVLGSTATMSALQAFGTLFLGKAYLAQIFVWFIFAPLGALLGYLGSAA